jgi:hypothetical protein
MLNLCAALLGNAAGNGSELLTVTIGSGAGGAVLTVLGQAALARLRGSRNGGELCAKHSERFVALEVQAKAQAKLLDERTKRIEQMVTQIRDQLNGNSNMKGR